MPESGSTTDSAFDSVVAPADAAMWVVTAVAEGQRAGCLVGFGAQVSIDPRRFLTCLSKTNHTYRVAARARHLAVHLLSADALAPAQLFGSETGSEIDKFEHSEWRIGPHSLPILTAAPGWFTGEILRTDDFGDHVGFLLEPTAAQAAAPDVLPLRYDAVAKLRPGHQA